MLQSVSLSHFPRKKRKKSEQNPIGAAPSSVPLSILSHYSHNIQALIIFGCATTGFSLGSPAAISLVSNLFALTNSFAPKKASPPSTLSSMPESNISGTQLYSTVSKSIGLEHWPTVRHGLCWLWYFSLFTFSMLPRLIMTIVLLRPEKISIQDAYLVKASMVLPPHYTVCLRHSKDGR